MPGPVVLPVVSVPAKTTRDLGSVPQARPVGMDFPRLRPFAPRAPLRADAHHCSLASSLLRPHPTSWSRPCRSYGLRPPPAGPATGLPQANSRISRFPHKKRMNMLRVYDSGGPRQHWRKRTAPYCLPNHTTRSASSTLISELNTEPNHTPANAWPRSLRTPAHDSGTWLLATHYHVTDFHRFLLADFYRRSLHVL